MKITRQSKPYLEELAAWLRVAIYIAAFAVSGLLRGDESLAVPLADDPACTLEDRKYMLRAYELAREASVRRDMPIGALLVKDGRILCEYSNTVYTYSDPTMHGETGLISVVLPKVDKADRVGAVLYTSTEPCVLCCGSIRSAGIKEVVYGTTALQVSRLAGRKLPKAPLECREIWERIGWDITVRGPLMEDEGFKVRAEHRARLATK
jgi:tRNA(Arg) A34 adenosine deaminase TadA